MSGVDKSGQPAPPVRRKPPAARHDAIVSRGRDAWGKIKATAAEQRQLWREVGVALLVGRRLHKADRAFKQWCDAQGFGDMKNNVRSDAMWWAQVCNDCNPPADLTHPVALRQWFASSNAWNMDIPATNRAIRANAMWLAENWAGVQSLHTALTNPSDIRDAFRAQAPAPSPDLTLDTPEPSVNLQAVAAGDETAKRHLEKKAKDFGGTVEEVVKNARAVAPLCGWPITGKLLGLLVRARAPMQSGWRLLKNDS